jgi:branched-chain amino acid transport system ATP-binding protein
LSEILALEARGIRAGYGHVLALDDVHFGLPARGVVAVLGANGAGKSTLLSVLSGQLQPWRGTIRVGDRSIRGLHPWDVARLGVCSVPEGGGIFQELSVRDNLRLATTASDDPADLDEAIALFPVLGRRLTQTAGSLSGGEKRMLALSRAVLARPTLLLVDEPSLGLAPIVVDEVFDVLGRLNRERGMSVVVVEQYVAKAVSIASWAYVLTKGRVSFGGTVEDLERSGVLEHAYLGSQGSTAQPLDDSRPASRQPSRRRAPMRPKRQQEADR